MIKSNIFFVSPRSGLAFKITMKVFVCGFSGEEVEGGGDGLRRGRGAGVGRVMRDGYFARGDACISEQVHIFNNVRVA